MAWYKTGSIKATQNSNVVIGTGTDWKNNLYGLGEGQALVFGNNRVEIMYVVSNTEIRLAEPYKGSAYTGAYHIENSFAGGSGDYVRQISAAIRRFAEWGLDLNEWMTTSADYIDVKDPNGNIIKIPTMKSYVKIGDYGLGYVATNNNNPKQNIYKDANEVDFTGFATGNASSINFFDYGSPLLSMARFGGSDSTGQIFQMQSRVSKTNQQIAYRTRNTGAWTDWLKLALLDTEMTQEFSGAVKARLVDAVGGDNYFGLRVHSNGTSALYGYRNKSGFDYTFPTITGEVVLKQGSYIVNYATNDWPGIRLYKANSEYITLEGSSTSTTLAQFVYRNSAGNNIAVVDIPKRNGTVTLSGDFGLGSAGLRDPSQVSCFYGSPSAGVAGFPSNGAGFQSTYGGNRRAMLFMNSIGYLMTRFSLSNDAVDTTTPWNTVWSSINTTVDSSGFIKRASPIVKIKGCGSCELNDESEGVTVKRVGLGHYHISNTEGLHSDNAWGIDGGISVPKDHNDQPLIWIEPEINADGSIDIYTFHRENYIPDNIRKMREKRLAKMGGVYASKVDGEPCDIPNGTFIDVRVEMPYNSIYNVKMRALENVFALEAIISKQQEILSNTTLQLPLR